jgi:hypothetical protein
MRSGGEETEISCVYQPNMSYKDRVKCQAIGCGVAVLQVVPKKGGPGKSGA